MRPDFVLVDRRGDAGARQKKVGITEIGYDPRKRQFDPPDRHGEESVAGKEGIAVGRKKEARMILSIEQRKIAPDIVVMEMNGRITMGSDSQKIEWQLAQLTS